MPSSKTHFKSKTSIKNKQTKCTDNLSINTKLSTSSWSIRSDFLNNYVDDEECCKQWRAHYSTNSSDNSNFSSDDSSKQSRLSGGDIQLSAGTYSNRSCKLQKREPKSSKVSVIDLKLGDAYSRVSVEYFKPPETKVKRRKIRGTQTIYRESSAQTLPYLPSISNDPQSIADMELFKLPTILPGDGPPGLYEVEVLERARKRWSFLNALKEKVICQKQAIREQTKQIIPKHILMAFEWEYWIEREEYIQECQMVRLEILVRMFNKRESSLHSASNKTIESSYERIQNERKAALKKNKIEHDRAMRRLSIKHSKESRVWRKENISFDFGKPSSEYYAPKMRYGVNPNRRHYEALRKGFDTRMEDLEKQAVKMDPKHLKCPFAKIKKLSKPKELLSEHERNFCSDVNLKKLYDGLRLLRKTSTKDSQGTEYRILRGVDSDDELDDDAAIKQAKSIGDEINIVKSTVTLPNEDVTEIENQSAEEAALERMQEEEKHWDYIEELKKENEKNKLIMEKLNAEFLREENENIYQSYEGLAVGWLMRFLGEEMVRAREQRRLHFYYMLAQRERWRREAVEAGLRQKENSLRSHYEQLYKQCSLSNMDVTQSYISEIMNKDIMTYAEQEAEEHIIELAKQIDRDVESWLECFKIHQNPLDYDIIRCNLRKNIMSDVCELKCREEKKDMINYIIYDVLFPNVFVKLEAYDICTVTTEEFIDRLFDIDLYYESTESSSVDEDRQSEQEVNCIMRKLIRYAVPGRRHLTPSERMAANNFEDIMDVVFGKLRHYICAERAESPVLRSMESLANVRSSPPPKKPPRLSSISQARASEIETASWHSDVKMVDNYTKELKRDEEFLLEDPDKISIDKMILNVVDYDVYPEGDEKFTELPLARPIPSTHNIQLYETFSNIPLNTYLEDNNQGTVSDIEFELFPVPPPNEVEDIGTEESLGEKEYIEDEDYVGDEESEPKKPPSYVQPAEELEEASQQSVGLNKPQEPEAPLKQRIKASFDLRQPSSTTRSLRKSRLPVKK
uniref:Cilia- and flagella-associated protein 91 n=1 Tax=Glossina brevipalpis TaxID=37001 RepID=A0A1A9WZZ5_9MUSC